MARENDEKILAEIEKLIITEDTDEEIFEDSVENQSQNVKNTEEPVAIERVIWHITDDDDDEDQDESQNEEPIAEEEKNETANNSGDSSKEEEKPVPT